MYRCLFCNKTGDGFYLPANWLQLDRNVGSKDNIETVKYTFCSPLCLVRMLVRMELLSKSEISEIGRKYAESIRYGGKRLPGEKFNSELAVNNGQRGGVLQSGPPQAERVDSTDGKPPQS